jgi:hypothetical protein
VLELVRRIALAAHVSQLLFKMSGLNAVCRSEAHRMQQPLFALQLGAAHQPDDASAVRCARVVRDVRGHTFAVGPARACALVPQSPLRHAKFGPSARLHRPAARSLAALSKLFQNRSIPQGRHEAEHSQQKSKFEHLFASVNLFYMIC